MWAPRTAADFRTQMELTKPMEITGVPVFVTTAEERTTLDRTENVMTSWEFESGLADWTLTRGGGGGVAIGSMRILAIRVRINERK